MNGKFITYIELFIYFMNFLLFTIYSESIKHMYVARTVTIH